MSTSAGTREEGDGRPPVGPQRPQRRDLRDRPLTRIVMLVVVLLAAVLAARTCASRDQDVSKDEAIEIAAKEAGFAPCAQTGCVVIRIIQRGIPPRLFWLVGIAPSLDEDGDPTSFRNYLVDAKTGEIRRT